MSMKHKQTNAPTLDSQVPSTISNIRKNESGSAHRLQAQETQEKSKEAFSDKEEEDKNEDSEYAVPKGKDRNQSLSAEESVSNKTETRRKER